jgi:hypothetical protein
MNHIPVFIYNWVDKRQRIPWLVRKLYPTLHFCEDLDFLLLARDHKTCGSVFYELMAECENNKCL